MMDKALKALLQIDELLPEAVALADLIQAAAGNDGIIDTESISRGADMLYSRLSQVSQMIKETMKEVRDDDGKTDL